jgi:hypothetical protein
MSLECIATPNFCVFISKVGKEESEENRISGNSILSSKLLKQDCVQVLKLNETL